MNTFQKYISYFFRIVILKTKSEFNWSLIVAIQDGRYVLNTKNANYSFGSLHRVFQRAFQKIKIKEQPIDSILLLGGGVGSVPSIIYKELKLTPTMDVVEVDKKVIEIGEEYFGFDTYPYLSIIIDDGLNYIKTTSKKYDLIVVDVFNDISVPNEYLSPFFFEQLKNRLNKNGAALFNFVEYNYETKQIGGDLKKVIKNIFSEVTLFKLEGINRVFYFKN